MEPKTKSGIEPARILKHVESYMGKGLPPVDQWHPNAVGEVDIFIARNGQWFYNGSPMEREALVRLFSTVLRKDEDDCYYLVTPVEKMKIQVEDVPFVALTLRVEGEGRAQQLYLMTGVGDEILLGREHPLRVQLDPATQEPAPYVLIRGRLEALVARSVYYELAELVEPMEKNGQTLLGVWSAGEFHVLGAA